MKNLINIFVFLSCAIALSAQNIEVKKFEPVAKDDTLMRRFYEQVPMLTNVEKQVVLLLRYGLSKTEVAFLLSRTVQSVVNTCNRLYDKSHENECNSSREAYEWIMNI